MKNEREGGCGVIGVACAEKIAGKHLLQALCQMNNRGNGKGGGIAAAGLSPEFFGVTQEILNNDYLLAVAYIDEHCRAELEKNYIDTLFDIDHVHKMSHLDHYSHLDVKPPEVVVYFIRPKLKSEHSFQDALVYDNSNQINKKYYSVTGEKRAFVLSQGKNLLVLKMVGFGEDVIRYYQLEEFKAHVWIGHHRYPTKGKVWHPGGAHPFVGMNEALVHNGDFANYYSICEYLAQRGIHPHFQTDTEVSALLFDLLHRTYKYPLEHVIESLAPTTERDFFLLPFEKQELYQKLQHTHLHASPDGPWFFLIAQSLEDYRLIGITDTSMLRPQVFALQEGPIPIGLSASEKQAIDAVLSSLSQENKQFWSVADKYWSARGGSHTDGGAFIFTVHPQKDNTHTLTCTDKFGTRVETSSRTPYLHHAHATATPSIPDLPPEELFSWAVQNKMNTSYGEVIAFLEVLKHRPLKSSLETMTLLLDRLYPIGKLRRSSLNAIFNQTIVEVLNSPSSEEIILNGKNFPSEGPDSLAQQIITHYRSGAHKIILFNCQGHRFLANGLGPNSASLTIDVYGSSGDYLGSGIDGAQVYVHGSGQDQLAQIMKSGTLVIHGDVGQAFMYGAKGGSAYIRGNAAGRPLINAVGKPRVIINGTALDYLAESFMAGNPLADGGFAVINGITFDEDGKIIEMETPYPGNNLFSLASGGALYLRDPKGIVVDEQLNGGEFGDMMQEDWNLIKTYLEENEKHFGIPVDQLLYHNGKQHNFREIYRKIQPAHVRVLQEEEAWVKRRD